MIRILLCLAALLLLAGNPLLATPESDFQAGVEAYSSGEWREAQIAFEAILAQDLVAGELYYNLGNCAFRQEEIAAAILYWERARRLLPGDADLERNLDLAGGLLADPTPPDVQLSFWRSLDRLLDALTEASWALIWLVGIWLLALSLFWRIRSTSYWPRRLLPYLIGLLLLVTSLLGTRLYRDSQDHRGVVMVQKVTVRSAPDSLAAELFDLHSGSRVQLLDATRSWRRIRLPNGQGGWLPAPTVTPI